MVNDIEEDLKVLLNSKLIKIRHDSTGFVLEFSNGRSFTGHPCLIMSDSKISADLKIFCGYHGKVLDDVRITRSAMG